MLATLRIRLALLGGALRAIAALALPLLRALPAADRGARIAAIVAPTEGQRHAFALLRAFWPNLMLSRRVITAYDNTGTAIVTRQRDVVEVLDREADFAVVYEPRMRRITAGENFFLGMQDSAEYTRDVSNMRLVVRRADVSERLVAFTAREASAIVAASGGALDVPAALTLPVAARIVASYFGTPGPSEQALIEQTTIMFWWLFADLAADPAIEARAIAAAADCRAMLEDAIAARHATPTGDDDILNRCLALQASGTPGMSDGAIRDNLIGLLIGLVPTLSKAAVLALNELLNRPAALAGAHAAARADDDALVAAHVFEALRFDPVNPIIYRRATRTSVIARGTLRARTIPAGTMVLAANLSAMFDPVAVEDPDSFRTDRPWGDYMLWGYGMHLCFGAQINRAVIPQMLKPLLRHKNLRAAGLVDRAGTPFPAHFPVQFDPG
nr:cytochrome P450 [Plastoroseomonas arctica]